MYEELFPTYSNLSQTGFTSYLDENDGAQAITEFSSELCGHRKLKS